MVRSYATQQRRIAVGEMQLVVVDVFGPGDSCQSPLLGEMDVRAVFPE